MKHRSGPRATGQNLVEYAIILPVLLLLILGTIEFSVIVYDYSTIANAAREGARRALIPQEDPIDREIAARQAVLSHAPALGLTDGNVSFTWDSVHKTVEVEVIYDVHLLTGALVEALGGRAVIPLHTSATMRSE